VVTVVVVPGSLDTPDELLEKVLLYLDNYRMLTTRLFVTLPFYIEVSVKASVIIKPEYLEIKVEERVKTTLADFLHPLTGGSRNGGWPFGRPVYVSEIYEIIDGVEGVDYVETGTVRLKKKDSDWQDTDLIIPGHGLVCPGIHIIDAKEN
jgi:hypothetical protein